MNISNVLRNAAALGGIATLIVCGTANAATPAKAKLSAATHAVKEQSSIRNSTRERTSHREPSEQVNTRRTWDAAS